MTRLLLLIGAAAMAVAAPAAAQHQHHQHHAPAKPKPAPKKKAPPKKKAAPKKPAAKKAVAKTSIAKKAAPKKAVKKPAPKKSAPKKLTPKKAAPAKPAVDPHAAHGAPAADPHAGHSAPAADPHAGHAVAPAVDPPVAPPPPQAFSGPQNAADLYFDDSAMARSRREMRREHGGLRAYRVFLDQFETRVRDDTDGYAAAGDVWYGGDIDKAWFKGELEGDWRHRPEQAEVQALWSHAIDPWFDLQTGVRLDLAGERRAHLVAGVQGLAPYWIEVDAAAFLSDEGDVTARVEAEHDLRITQQLILQPWAEADFALQDVPEQRLGAGLSQLELGARLRYQLRPEFAPYVGVHFERAFGDSRRFRRLDGEDEGGFSLTAGIRAWF